MTDSVSTRLPSWTSRAFVIAALAIAFSTAFSFQSVFAQKEKPVPTAEDRSHEATHLKQAFGGMQVDLFFVMGELESQKPGLSGVKFVDAVDVTGKELLRFERGGETWLIDPDTVFAYHLHKAK
jgi:hypothetical protein